MCVCLCLRVSVCLSAARLASFWLLPLPSRPCACFSLALLPWLLCLLLLVLVLCSRPMEYPHSAGAGAPAAVPRPPKRRRVSEALEVGICWVNCSQPCFCQAPWGGVKDSGFGRELGTFGLDSFLSVKQVCDSAVHWGEGGDGLGLGTQAP